MNKLHQRIEELRIDNLKIQMGEYLDDMWLDIKKDIEPQLNKISQLADKVVEGTYEFVELGKRIISYEELPWYKKIWADVYPLQWILIPFTIAFIIGKVIIILGVE